MQEAGDFLWNLLWSLRVAVTSPAPSSVPQAEREGGRISVLQDFCPDSRDKAQTPQMGDPSPARPLFFMGRSRKPKAWAFHSFSTSQETFNALLAGKGTPPYPIIHKCTLVQVCRALADTYSPPGTLHTAILPSLCWERTELHPERHHSHLEIITITFLCWQSEFCHTPERSSFRYRMERKNKAKASAADFNVWC